MPFKCISISEATELIASNEVTVADVRDENSYAAGSIENSVNVLQGNVEDFLAATDMSKPLIIYCYHGHSSQGAADYFSSKGFAEVYSVDGGYEAWRSLF